MSEVGLFLAVALVYFVGRLAILGGLGGKSEKGLSVRQIAINYVADFFRPVILRSVKLTHITIIGVASGILISVAIVLYMNWVARSKRPSQSESLLGSRRIMDRKGVWLLLSWLFSLLGVFAFTRTFNHYNMYMPVIPFSVLFSVLLSESLRLALRGITVSDSVSISYIHYIGTAANCLLMIVLVNLLITSPVLNSYREWEISGDIAEMVLPQIVSVVEGAGEVKYLDIQNVPLDIASYPYRLSVTYLDKRVFESWIKLMTGKYVTVSVDRVIYRAVPRDITVEPIRNYQGKYEVSLFPVW
jgi:hypothetical protein